MDIDLKEIGERIKYIRGNLTQKEFADILNTKQNYISRYEKGERIPSLSLLIKIAELGNVSLDWLIRGSKSKVHKVKEPFSPYGNDKGIIKLLRKIKDRDKKIILMILKGFISGYKKGMI
jgi:transcriptional regulator with XRE-family HTH domain